MNNMRELQCCENDSFKIQLNLNNQPPRLAHTVIVRKYKFPLCTELGCYNNPRNNCGPMLIFFYKIGCSLERMRDASFEHWLPYPCKRCSQQLINAIIYCLIRGVYHTDLTLKNSLSDAQGTLKKCLLLDEVLYHNN